MDSIEYCVNQTGDHVGQARGELIKAEEYQSKARKVKNIRYQTHDRDLKLGKSVSRVILRGRRAFRGKEQISRVSINSIDINAANSRLNLERSLLFI